VTRLKWRSWLAVAVLAGAGGCATPRTPAPPARPGPEPRETSLAERVRFVLSPDDYWRLNPPDGRRFDASGLAFLPSGELLVVNNLEPRLQVVRFGTAPHVAELEPWPGGLGADQLRPFAAGKRGAWDFEGLAVDEVGRVYACEEGNYWVLRLDPGDGAVERLPLDWRDAGLVPAREDPNASLEGVAVGRRPHVRFCRILVGAAPPTRSGSALLGPELV
jgi:hypothetical protein